MCNPSLVDRGQTIPFLGWPGVQPGGEEEMDAFVTGCLPVYGLHPKSTVLAHSSMQWKSTSGASTAE